jgi:hypothetical protein
MSKKVFNLSIKDLKEILGVAKKKKRRKRNKKNINKLNVRSSSNHMASSSFIPTNVNTLQNDNLHLINQQLQKKLNETPAQPANDLVVSNKNDDMIKLQNDVNSMRDQGINYINDLYRKTSDLSNIKSKNIDTSNIARSDIYNDNIDVSTTGGDNSFQNIKTGEPDLQYTDIYKDKKDELPMQSAADETNPIRTKRAYNKKTDKEKEDNNVANLIRSKRIADNKQAKENLIKEKNEKNEMLLNDNDAIEITPKKKKKRKNKI